MANIQNIITLGIGSDPGSIKWFVTFGLGIGEAILGQLNLTAETRTTSLTAETREVALTAETRAISLTAETRP